MNTGKIIDALIGRLDRLDGTPDGRYAGLPLRTGNTTGVCRDAAEGRARMERGELPPGRITTTFAVDADRVRPLDCAAVVAKLSLLVEIQEHNPATAFLQRPELASEAKRPLKRLTYADFWAHHLVDAMIGALLMGKADATDSFGAIFGAIDVAEHSARMAAYAPYVKNHPLFPWRPITTARGAFRLFRRFGNIRHIDTQPFDPAR